MHDFITAVILGIVEGVTEFLPVSSTGHLIIVNQYVAFTDGPAPGTAGFASMFDIVIQSGAILAVVVYYWRRLIPFGSNVPVDRKKSIFDLWKKTMVGVVPALVIGKLAHDFIEEKLFNPVTVAIALVVGGIILIIIERRKPAVRLDTVAGIGYRTALYIGLIQCLAMVPGTSRSAVTIIGAMLLGASRLVAAEFSFFLAIPTIAAASGYSLLKTGLDLTLFQFGLLLTGFLVSFLVAWLVIKLFITYISKHDFTPFGYYRIAVGMIILFHCWRG